MALKLYIGRITVFRTEHKRDLKTIVYADNYVNTMDVASLCFLLPI